MSHLTKITREAKRIRKSHPRMKWTEAIKQASRKYRTGKIGTVKKYKQTGTSKKKADEKRKAKKPGIRRSASGNRYRETRKNRSDRPGSLTGVSAGTLSRELIARKKDQLAKALLQRETATTRKGYNNARDRVSEIKSSLRRLQD